MKKEAPKAFLDAYEARRKKFEQALEQIGSLLRLRLSQMAATTGIRGRITDGRLKRPGRLWKKAQERGLGIDETFTKIPDLLGIRVVCHNLSDISDVVTMIKSESRLKVLSVDDKIVTPGPDGYRAVHVLTCIEHPYNVGNDPIPFEVQIRTLAQDTWGRLSHADLYRKHVPPVIKELSRVLADQLAAIDRTAQLIRNELNGPGEAAGTLTDNDQINPPRLATLFKERYGKEIYKYMLIDWWEQLQEAEVENIGEVKVLLDDSRLRERLNEISGEIRRGMGLTPEEWTIFSAMVAAEASRKSGMIQVRKKIQDEWDEITEIARREVLPPTIKDFVKSTQSGNLDLKACMDVLDCFDSCSLCGTEVFKGADYAAAVVLDYYKQKEDKWDIEEAIEEASAEEGLEEEDSAGMCSHCSYIWRKDD